MSKPMIHRIELGKDDADVEIVFPGGATMVVQARPSNADENYNGSLDVILPSDNLCVTWQGDDMEGSIAPNPELPHERRCKQIVTELPGNYDA